MRTLVLLAVGIAGVLVPATARAGAPNYDCVVGSGGARIAIDQWAPDVVATGLGPGRSVLVEARDVDQNGPTLTLTDNRCGCALVGRDRSDSGRSHGSPALVSACPVAAR